MTRLLALGLSVSLALTGCAGVQPTVEAPAPAASADAHTAAIEKAMAERRAAIEKNPIYLIMAGELAGQANQPKEAASFYAAAAQETDQTSILARATQIALFAKDYPLAQSSAARWLAQAPHSAQAAASLTVSALQQGDEKTADQALTQWLAQPDVDGLEVFNELGGYLEKNVDPTRAIQFTDHLAARYPNRYNAQLVVAKLNLKFKRWESAIHAARRAIEISPKQQNAYDVLIVALSQNADNSGMIQALKQAHARFPQEPRYLGSLIDAYIQQGESLNAAKLIETALKRPDKNPDYWRTLALQSLQADRPVLAKQALEKLGRLPGQSDLASLLLGRVEAQNGQFRQAVKNFNRIPPTSPHYAEARVLLAAAYAQTGDVTGALESLDIAIDAPVDVADRQRLILAKAGLQQSQGLNEEALQTLNQAVARWPESSDLQLQRALLLFKFNRNAEGRATLREILRQEPNNAQALNALGYTLADENRDLDEARQLIERAVKQDPDNAAYLDSLGWVQYRQGQLAEAEKTLQRAFNLVPDAEVGAHWGTVLWHLNRRAEAEAIWKRALEIDRHQSALRQAIEKYAPQLLQPDAEQ
ncbi:tetratricopeptide repeat protein [Halothiobacillus sp. DCM-1]|uniref:tetratricopeptide repeat protein n=1 Tax=Halothiobacillus sp. DCM-1 TaxID=3112558 RepID=UPI003254EDA4